MGIRGRSLGASSNSRGNRFNSDVTAAKRSLALTWMFAAASVRTRCNKLYSQPYYERSLANDLVDVLTSVFAGVLAGSSRRSFLPFGWSLSRASSRACSQMFFRPFSPPFRGVLRGHSKRRSRRRARGHPPRRVPSHSCGRARGRSLGNSPDSRAFAWALVGVHVSVVDVWVCTRRNTRKIAGPRVAPNLVATCNNY